MCFQIFSSPPPTSSYLLYQLYDLDKQVALVAVDILDEACEEEVRVLAHSFTDGLYMYNDKWT